MPNDSNIIEEHLRIVIDPATYSEINRISESVREMREDFSEMPHLGEMLNSSLERTSTLTDTVNRKLQKASDITFDTQDDRDRYSANAHASVEDLRVMHKLQSTNDDFNPVVVRSWAKGLSSALSKELDAIIPDLAGIFRSRMSPLTTAGNSAYKNTFQEVAGLSQAMFQDKSVQQLLKSRVTQSYSDDVIKQLLRVVVANSSPMMRLDDYTNLRYNSNVRENAKAAELNSPIALLPASFQSSFKNKGYLSRGEDANEQRKWLTASAYKVIQKLLAENPVAVNAAVRSGIARRDDRGVLELQRNISRKDYDDLRRSIYGEFTARATGAGEHRVADIYTDDPAAAKIVAGRMAGSSSAGSVIRAMQQLEALESVEAWMDRQRQGSAYVKQIKEPKRALDQYSILSFAPFDSTKRPQKEVSITESNNTRLLGLQSRGYNGDVSDAIATISLSGYDKNNEAHVAELRKLFEEGKEVQSIGGKPVRMRVQSMHRGDDGAILRLVEESAMAAVDEQLRPIAEAAGLSGSYWTNYQNTDRFDDLVHYRKHLDARNKGWTPSADLGLNLDGKKIAVVSMSTVDGDNKTELADGTGWLSEDILPTPIQFRGGVSGKGTLRPLPGETNRDFAIRSGLATQDQDGQWHWYVQGANPNDAPIDIIDYNGFVDKSVIKNMSAYRNADGTLKSSKEINDTFMEMLRISPLSVVKDFSKMDSESDRIGVQMMSFMDISPELQMRQQQQLSKRLQELDTEEGMLKYVFPASNEDYLSTQVNDPEKRWLLQGVEAQKRVALYREELMRKAMSGEWIDFGDNPNDTISNVELAGSPLAAFFRMNGVNDDVRKIAKEALTKEFGKEYSDQEIDDILKLRGTKRNADGTIEYGYGIDFGRADQEELGFLRSPTGYGNMVVARNVAKEVQAIYAALAGNIPEGMDSSMFSKDFLEAGGVILAPEDLKTLSGADLDADTVKTVTGSLKDAVKSTIEHTVMMPEKDTQLQITKRKQDGVISDSVENQIAAVDDLTYEPLGMGLYSGAIRGRQFDPTNPEYIDRIRGFHKGQVGYDATTTIFKDPKEIARDKDIDKAIAAGKEYTRFTQNVKDIFSLDEDMYDDNGNILDAHGDMYRASNGTVINMRKLKELDLLHTNLPSVYMDNHVLGLASMGRQYREGRVDTTRFDAMAEALSHMSEYDQELYGTAGTQTKALMDTVNQLYPQFGTGKRTKLTGDETKQLRGLYDSALGEIVQQAMEQEIAPGRVLNNEGKQVSTNWLVHNLKKKYGLTRVENTLKEFGFTNERLAVGLPESLQGFFVNSADAQLNVPEASQVNVATVAANAPQIMEQLNKAKEEAAAEINRLEQEKAELDKKLSDVSENGVMQTPITQEEHDQIETRKQEIDRQIAAKQTEYQNTDAMQRQAIEWYKDQVEFESVFASAREFNSGLWKSRLSKEAHIEDKSQADLYYNKQHGIANYHATMLDDLIKRTGLSGEQKETLIKLRSDILSGVDVDFADKTVSNAKHLSESLNARVAATSIDYDKTEHEIDGYIKKLKEAEEYQKKLIDMDSEGKFADEIKQTGEYIDAGYKTAEKLRHNLYTQDIAGEDKMITRLQRFTRDRNRRYSQSAFERQMLVNENDYEQYEQQYEAIAHRLSIWQSRRRGLVANGQIDTENYKLATQEINRLSSALSECQKEMDALSGTSGKLNAGLTVAGQAANRVVTQFGHRVFNQAVNEAKSFVVTYDAAMTEIQMVTLKTEDEISALGSGLIDKAVELRAGVGEVTSAATSLYRQGLNDSEVDARLEDVIKFSKTAKVSTTDSIKLATVAMNSGDVESTEHVFDVVSALGDSAATEAAEITKGLKKSLSAAASVGVSFEDLVAMLTVITSKTQLSGSVAGTTMRNVMSRMTRFGDQDSRYASQVQLLNNAGVEIFEGGEMRSVTKILSEIGALWESFDDRTKADIAYALGGTEQFSNVTALMQGFSETDENGVNLMQKYIELANTSDGITNQKYMHQIESLDGAMTNLRTTFDQLVASAENTGAVIDFLDFVADGVAGFADLNTHTEGLISNVVALTAALIGLAGLAKTHPYMLAMMGIAAGAVAIGKIGHEYAQSKKAPTFADRVSDVNDIYDQNTDTLSTAQKINEKRIKGQKISAAEEKELEQALIKLDLSGNLSFDGLKDSAGNAITTIDKLASSANATAKALDGASDAIETDKANRLYNLSLDASNEVQGSITQYQTDKQEYEERKSIVNKGVAARDELLNPGTFSSTTLEDYALTLLRSGALDSVSSDSLDGKTIRSLYNPNTGKYDEETFLISVLQSALPYVDFSGNVIHHDKDVYDALMYYTDAEKALPFTEDYMSFGTYNAEKLSDTLIGRDTYFAESGLMSIVVKGLQDEINKAYAASGPEGFNYNKLIEDLFYVNGSVDKERIDSFAKSTDEDAYLAVKKETEPAKYLSSVTRLSQSVDSAMASSAEADYEDSWIRMYEALRNTSGIAPVRLHKFANIITNDSTGIPEWDEMIRSKGSEALVNAWSSLVEVGPDKQHRIRTNVTDEELETFMNIIGSMSERTALMTHRDDSTVSQSASNVFSRLSAIQSVDDRIKEWVNLSADDATNKQMQGDLQSVLGEDLAYRFVNGLLDEEGTQYAQSLIDRAVAQGSIAPGDNAKNVQNMVAALMGTSSEQMEQFATTYAKDESLSHGMYAYNRIAVTGGTESDFATLGEALGLDAETVKRLSSTDEGKKLLENSLNNQISTFSSTLSDALIAMLPDPSILATMSGFDSDQIAEALSGTLSEGALSIIQMLGGKIQNGEFVFDVDAMSSYKSFADAANVAYENAQRKSITSRLFQAINESMVRASGYKDAPFANRAHLVTEILRQQYADLAPYWEDFTTNDSRTSIMWKGFESGSVSWDDFQKYLQDNSAYGVSGTTAQRSANIAKFLGEDWLTREYSEEDWQRISENMLSAASSGSPLDQLAIADFQEAMGGTGLDQIIMQYRELANGAQSADAGIEELRKNFNSDALAEQKGYLKSLSKVDKLLSDIASKGKDAASAYSEMHNEINNARSFKDALAQYKSGNRSEEVLNMLQSNSEYSADDLKKFKAGSLDYEVAISNLDITYDAAIDELEETLDNAFMPQIYNAVAAFEAANPGIEIDMGSLWVKSGYNLNAFVKMLQDLGVDISANVAALASQLSGVGIGINGEFDEALGKFVFNTDATVLKGSTSYRSGGSGGSKKSDADKLVERLGHGQSLYEHQIKMVQYEQTKYENADELGNYGRMLEEEIKIEQAYLPVLESNIAALRNELSEVKEGSEDWYKLRDAILEAEEQYADINNTIDENEKKLKENQQAILKLHTDLEEIVVGEIELRIENEKEMLDGSVSMQDIILNAVKQRYQDEWDLIKQDIDKKKEALQQEKDLIDERLDARREAEDEAAKYEELAELKKQLSLISMDSTRTKDAAALRESIAELEKEIGWDIAEKEAENEKNAIQDQIDAYDDYVAKGDEDLDDLLSDANNFSEEVNGVLKLNQEELFNWLKNNVKEYANSLDDAQKQMVQSWEATYKQMLGITDTYWDEVNAILSSKDIFLEYMKQSNEYIYASEDERAQLLYQWEEAYDMWRKAQKNDADYSHGDAGLGDWSGSEYTGSSSGSGSGGGSSGTKTESENTNVEIEANAKKYYVYDGTGKSSGPYSSLSVAESLARQAADRGNGSYVKDGNGNIVVRYSASGETIDAISGADSNKGNISTNNSRLPRTGWPDYLSVTSDHGYYYKITENGINVGISDKAYSTRDKAAAEAQKKLKSGQKYQTKYFLHGGIADFTGPAWLDGSPSEPERILSADQTRDFEALVAIMDDFRNSGVSMDVLRSMAKWSTSISVPTSLSHIGNAAYQGNSANIGDIFVNITEAQITDDRDIEELANIVGQKFVKEIGKQGFNVSNYNF